MSIFSMSLLSQFSQTCPCPPIILSRQSVRLVSGKFHSSLSFVSVFSYSCSSSESVFYSFLSTSAFCFSFIRDRIWPIGTVTRLHPVIQFSCCDREEAFLRRCRWGWGFFLNQFVLLKFYPLNPKWMVCFLLLSLSGTLDDLYLGAARPWSRKDRWFFLAGGTREGRGPELSCSQNWASDYSSMRKLVSIFEKNVGGRAMNWSYLCPSFLRLGALVLSIRLLCLLTFMIVINIIAVTKFIHPFKQSTAIYQQLKISLEIAMVKKAAPVAESARKPSSALENGKKTPSTPQKGKKSPPGLSSRRNETEEGMFDSRILIQQQKDLESMCVQAQKKGEIEFFDKVKYKQIIYEVGEYIHLFSQSHADNSAYIAQLKTIIKIPNQLDVKAILKVQWLMRKQDLPKKFQPHIKNFSIAEVFPSGQSDYVYIESIKGKCNVLTYNEYEFLMNTGDSIHFSRAIFDPKSGELKPGLEEWEKTCYCNTPPNPDLAYVQCDKCELWVHHDCIEKKEDAESETFICRNCKVQRR